MWTRPGYKPDRPEPPTEKGERRISLDEFNGHNFISLRIWEADQSGGMWPTKKGATVRLKEAHDLARTLVEASEKVLKASAPATRQEGADERPQFVGRGR